MAQDHASDASNRANRCVVPVKGGNHVGPDLVRERLGTVERTTARVGVLIVRDRIVPELHRASAAGGATPSKRAAAPAALRQTTRGEADPSPSSRSLVPCPGLE